MGLVDNITFNLRNSKALAQALISLFKLCEGELDPSMQNWLIEDFGQFIHRGKRIVYNTYNGGILFLREPERIEEIRLEFSSQLKTAWAIVEFDTANRNERNTKYKPTAGKLEAEEWNLEGIFPQFKFYPPKVQAILISALCKIGKEICEQQNRESWYMKYTHDFKIKAMLDNEVVDWYEVKKFRD